MARKFYSGISEQRPADRYIHVQDDYKNRRGIPALPFSKWQKTMRKPLGEKYVISPVTIGDKIRNHRLEKELLQKEVAEIIGVTEDCMTNWENNLSAPETRYLPAIIKFLGYIPFSANMQVFGERLQFCRLVHGLTHRQMGKQLNVDGSTVGSWENGEHMPQPAKQRQVEQVISGMLVDLPSCKSD